MHRKEAETVCTHCQKRFSTRSALRNYVAYLHMDERKYACDTCSKKLSSKKDLTNHIRQHHCDSDTKLKCGTCDKGFGFSSSLKRHMQNCGQKTKVTCPVCNKTFSSGNSFYSHKRAKHSNLLIFYLIVAMYVVAGKLTAAL